MKKYEVISDDIPGVDIGDIFTDCGDGTFHMSNGRANVCFRKDVIEVNAGVFKLIEEKRFTESDMISFGVSLQHHLPREVVIKLIEWLINTNPNQNY